MMPTKKSKKSKDRELTPAQEMRERLFNCQRSRQHTLNLTSLGLTEFPNETTKFSNLKVLDASKNSFVHFLPMAHFRMLEEMNMSRNFIRTVEHVMFSNHQELRVLNLSRNEIEFLPEGLSQLPLLEVLDLSYNNIKVVPECMTALSALRSVDLSHNGLRSVGGVFERMVGLASLDLSSNPDLDVEKLPLRTRRLIEKQLLLKSKAERRALVQRALGIRRSVLQQEQSHILRAREDAQENSEINLFP